MKKFQTSQLWQKCPLNCYLSLCGRKAASQRTSTDSTSSFRRSLLNVILDVLQLTPCAVSSGAVHWLFKLLTGFAAQADSTLTSFVCLEMLEFLSSKLATARLREHLSLRARSERQFTVIITNMIISQLVRAGVLEMTILHALLVGYVEETSSVFY